jgi:hypothetical protein
MNMASGLGQTAQRFEFSNVIAQSAQEISSNTRASCDEAQQGRRWDTYTRALARALETQNQGDARLAYEAWLDFNRAYLTEEEQRPGIAIPALLRELL